MGAAALRSIEHFDDRARITSELVKYENDRFLRSDDSFVERYIRENFHIIVRYTLPNESQYGFILYRDGFRGWPEVGDSPKLQASRKVNDREKPTVLAHDVELMERPQHRVPSLIRLQRFQDAAFSTRKPLYEIRPLISLPRAKKGLAGDDRKIRVFGIRYAEPVVERSSENVETATNGVDISADFDQEFERKRCFLDCHDEPVRRIRIKVDGAGLDVQLEPSIEATLEGWELGYGPINASLSV